jgi:hypothetical protein
MVGDLMGEPDAEGDELIDCEAESPDETLYTGEAEVTVETVLADDAETRPDFDKSPLRLMVIDTVADSDVVGHSENAAELEGLPDAVAGVERDGLDVRVRDSHFDTVLVAQEDGVTPRADMEALFAVPELLVLIRGDLDALSEELPQGEAEAAIVSLDEELSSKESVDEKD